MCQQLDFSPRLVIREVVYWIRRGRVAGLESLMTSVLSPRRWRGLVASHRRRRAGSAHSSYLVSDSAGQRGGRERVPPSPLPSSVDTAGHSCGLAHNGVGSVGLVQDTNADRLGLALAGRRWSLHRWLWSIRLTEAGGAPRGDGEVLARRCARDCCQPAATRGWPGGPACRRNDSWTGAVMSPEPPVVLPRLAVGHSSATAVDAWTCRGDWQYLRVAGCAWRGRRRQRGSRRRVVGPMAG